MPENSDTETITVTRLDTPRELGEFFNSVIDAKSNVAMNTTERDGQLYLLVRLDEPGSEVFGIEAMKVLAWAATEFIDHDRMAAEAKRMEQEGKV